MNIVTLLILLSDNTAYIMSEDMNIEGHTESLSQPVDCSDDGEIIDEVWDVEEQAVVDDFHSEANTDQEQSMKSLNWIFIFILMWSTTYQVSAATVSHLLKFISYIQNG